MATRIVDIDKVVSRDAVMVVDGVEYQLPGDPPVELYLQFIHLSEQIDEAENGVDEAPLLQELHDLAVRLFRLRSPELDALPIGVSSLIGGLGLYFFGGGEVVEDPPVKRPARKAGTRNTSRSTSKTSRSSRS